MKIGQPKCDMNNISYITLIATGNIDYVSCVSEIALSTSHVLMH